MHILRDLGECGNYEIGGFPYTLTVFHEGTDGLELGLVKVPKT